MDDSKISGETWDIVEGCTKISSGCTNCYAERRLGKEQFEKVTLHYEKLNEAFTWTEPKNIFISENCDLFHKDVKKDFLDQLFDVIRKNPKHHFVMLTKRPERINEDKLDLPENTWFGISAENQEMLDKRAPFLSKVKSRIKYISAQPLLGPLDLSKFEFDWILAGAEYGPTYREMNLDWVRSIRDQAKSRKIPFLLQQAIVNGERIVLPKLDGRQEIGFRR